MVFGSNWYGPGGGCVGVKSALLQLKEDFKFPLSSWLGKYTITQFEKSLFNFFYNIFIFVATHKIHLILLRLFEKYWHKIHLILLQLCEKYWQ